MKTNIVILDGRGGISSFVMGRSKFGTLAKRLVKIGYTVVKRFDVVIFYRELAVER